MDINLIKSLSEAVGIGHLQNARDLAKSELERYAEVSCFGQTGLIAKINKGKEKTLLLDAHIDEVGFIVTSVLEDGFLKVAAVGGCDARILPATPVIIHGKENICGVFSSVPPHLAKDGKSAPELDDLFVDTGLGNAVCDIVSPGDYVTYKKEFTLLQNGKICGKSLDDRICVACLIELAKRIYDKDLPVNVIINLAEQEELGTRGARTSAFACDASEAIALDVSFGDAPDVSSHKCGKLGYGVMVGISPILSRKISDKLISLAEKNKIPHQKEVMGGATGTDADVISVTKSGCPSGLLSVPLRNMHTPCEVVDIKDAESLIDLLEKYIVDGGEQL